MPTPWRLPEPAGPPAPVTNPFGIPSGLTPATQPQSTTLAQSAANQYFNPETGMYQANPYSYGGNGRKRLPINQQLTSTFGPAAPVKPNYPVTAANNNPFGIPEVPWNSYANAANVGMAKTQPNQFGISQTFQPPAGKQSTGINESRNLQFFNPETGVYQNEPYYNQAFTKIEPMEVSAVGETPSYTIDTVTFYDPTIANYDENIKEWYADQSKTYLLPDQGKYANMTQEQWDAINAQAPDGYEYTPWGWMSTDYINSLIGTGGTGGYDYGGYSWGGGGGGRSKMDQFYFGLMNWGI
jgi:hypothetical protein